MHMPVINLCMSVYHSPRHFPYVQWVSIQIRSAWYLLTPPFLLQSDKSSDETTTLEVAANTDQLFFRLHPTPLSFIHSFGDRKQRVKPPCVQNIHLLLSTRTNQNAIAPYAPS